MSSPLLGFDLTTAASLLTGFAAMALMVALYAGLTVRDPMARRVKALNERREQLKAGITASTRKRAKLARQSQGVEQMRTVLANFRVLGDKQLKDTQRQLMQAGIRNKDAAVPVIFARVVAPVALGLVMAGGVYGLGWFGSYGPLSRYLFVAGSVALGYYGPHLFLRNRINKRSAAIRKALPDALDLLVICAEAGLTVDAAFHRVARELGKGAPELGDEFGLTAIELGFLTERRIAFENLAMRVDLDSVRGVVTTMIQTEKYGTPLASALRVLSAEYRHERMMRAEEKAARLPAIMTVPLILFILPVLFVVILGPATCNIVDTFATT